LGGVLLRRAINGTLVYDGYLLPPYEIGALPKPPVKIRVKRGNIVDIERNATGIDLQEVLDSFNDEA